MEKRGSQVISPAERVRRAQEESNLGISGTSYEGERSEKYLGLIAGLISVVVGFFLFGQLDYFYPLTAVFLLLSFAGVTLSYVSSLALVERRPLPGWSVTLTWWVLPISLIFIALIILAALSAVN